MYSRAHGTISLVVGLALVALGVEWATPVAVAAGAGWAGPAVVVAYATVVGVAIDFDHFLVARINTGSWRPLRYVLANPRRALADQSTIFRPTDLGPFDRLLSHAVIVGAAVPATWWVDPELGLTTGVVLYAHVLADLVADVRQFEAVERDR